jgi:hypothetical protein
MEAPGSGGSSSSALVTGIRLASGADADAAEALGKLPGTDLEAQPLLRSAKITATDT